MLIRLKRQIVVEDFTMGELLVDGAHFAWTLEDPIREVITVNGWTWEPHRKLYGRTAIPSGRYVCTVTYSNRFKRRMPLLVGVPDFTGVRFHGGNTVEDTEGCPLMGRQRDIDAARVSNCDGLTEQLVMLIDGAEQREKVYCEVSNP